MRVYLTVSGSGQELDIGQAQNFVDADALVAALDVRFSEWEEQGFPELLAGDPLNGYEGCDVYCTDGVTVWYLDEHDDWEIF